MHMCIDTGMASCKRKPSLGVPQGSITSPRAWNDYFEPALQEANRYPCKVVAYADDSSMSFVGPDFDTVRRIAQNTISKIVNFCKEAGISFNPGKTEVLHFGKDPGLGVNLKELTKSLALPLSALPLEWALQP